MNLKATSKMEENTKTRYSKTIEKVGMSKTMSIEEVENGYVITIDKSWEDEKEGYKYECKKFISTSNPLESKEDETNDVELLSTIKNLF